MLRDRFSKSVTLLSVLDCFFKGCPRDAEASRRDIEPLGLKAGHHLLESETFHSADKIATGNRKAIEMQIDSFARLVSHLVDIAPNSQALCALFRYQIPH